MDNLDTSTDGKDPKVPTPAELRKQRIVIFWAVVAGLVVLGGVGTSIWYLLLDGTDTAKIRDTFVIVMAVELLLIGVTMVILLVQIAKLVNLIQNEVKPLLETANETMNTVRGTAAFLSEAITEPVYKLNSFVAGLQKAIEMLNLFRK